MLQQTNTRRGNPSFYLGGKGPSDTGQWKPNIEAVRATVQYAIDTGRFEAETEQPPSPRNSNNNDDNDDNPTTNPLCTLVPPASAAEYRTLNT